MLKIQSVLVPIDFSEGSRAALHYACELALKFGARIQVLHAWYAPEYISPSIAVTAASGEVQTIQQAMSNEAQRQMDQFLATATIPEGVDLEAGFGLGGEARVICDAAAHHDLIVMGTHGRSGVARLFMGSITEKVIREAPCPVVVIRENKPEPVDE